MTSTTSYKKEGFVGQKMVTIPTQIRNDLIRDPITESLYFTSIGYFPLVENHYVHRPHGLHEYTIILCLSGEGWSTFRGQTHTICAGEFFILPPNEEHCYGSKTGVGWQKIWICFSGSMSSTFVNRINASTFGSPCAFYYSSHWLTRFNDMIDELSGDLSFDTIARNCTKLWAQMADLVYTQPLEQSSSQGIERVLTYMRKNIHNYVMLDEFAAIANLSVSHFSSQFKVRTQVSPMRYFNTLKINEACNLLTMSRFSIKEICRELSFADPAYFSRLFKKEMGQSPQAYRDQNKQQL